MGTSPTSSWAYTNFCGKNQMNDILVECVRKSKGRSGMGSVSMSYDPYLCLWTAEANWSDSVRVLSDGFDSPKEAVEQLSNKLDILPPDTDAN